MPGYRTGLVVLELQCSFGLGRKSKKASEEEGAYIVGS